jgi:hypothetical protein
MVTTTVGNAIAISIFGLSADASYLTAFELAYLSFFAAVASTP